MDAETENLECPYPLDFLQPKKETQLDSFLAKYPEYDGRGILIGILDTGVDVAVPGMQVTTEGKPKVVDVMDCSGAGDVNTSAVRTLDENGCIVGLTGRKLKIPSGWQCPSGEFHVGVKVLFELFGKALKDRIKKRRKDALWDPATRSALANAKRALADDENSVKSIENLSQKWAREELLQRVDSLKQYDKEYDDCGLTADCVVFSDGQNWKCCIDTSFRGDLDKCDLLGVYRDTQQYARYSDEDYLTYAINVHNDGNLLEIFAPSNSHGTHVACIAAGCFPEQPALNGVAPGAQIVSLAISDSRIGSMETGTAMARALRRCVDLGVNVINYSFGESAHVPNVGRIIQYIEETVSKYGILFIASAGNNGPALSTGGCPGSTSTSIIGVGAYLSTSMAAHMYSVRDKLPSTLFPWSASGPALVKVKHADGSLGVCISAPGAAITCMPKWTLKSAQLLNGTSMSSPHVTGAVACLLGGLKRSKVAYSPFSVRRAIENTARLTEQDQKLRFAIGHGLLQVDAAFDYLTKHTQQFLPGLVRYNVYVGGDPKNRGIYLRDRHQLAKAMELSVCVAPVFHEDAPNDQLLSFTQHLVLTCDAPWVVHPKTVELCNSERAFSIRVDPTCLLGRPNECHFTQLVAHDSACISAGPVWRLPITVIVPDACPSPQCETSPTSTASFSCNAYQLQQANVSLAPAERRRHFIHVPAGADWAVIRLRMEEAEASARFVIHTVQLSAHESYRTHESFKMMTLSSTGECALSTHVLPESTLELCITKWWASLPSATISYSLKFHGVSAQQNNVCMLSHELVHKLDCTTYLRSEELSPTVTLRHACLPLKPVNHRLGPLDHRDVTLGDRQLWALTLNYTFSVNKQTDAHPVWPGLSEYLYENELDSQVWMIHTINKEYVVAGDAYPQRNTAKLAKGDYRLSVCFRHESEARLEQLTSLGAVMVFKLGSSSQLDVYDDYASAVAGGKKAGGLVAQPHCQTRLYVKTPAADKLPKAPFNGIRAGCYYEGSIVYPKDEYGRKASQWPFRFVHTKPVPVDQGGKADAPKTTVAIVQNRKPKRTPNLPDSIRDLRISWIGRMRLDTKAAKLYDELKAECPAHLPVYLAYLRRCIENKSLKSQSQIVSVTDKIVSLVDQERLLKHMGHKADLGVAPEMPLHEFDEQKEALTEALLAKANLLIDLYFQTLEASDVRRTVYAELFGDGAEPKQRSPVRPTKSDGSIKSESDSTGGGGSPRDTSGDTPGGKANTGSHDSLEGEILDVSGDAEEPWDEVGVPAATQPPQSDVSQPSLNISLEDLVTLYVELRKWVEANDQKLNLYSIKLALAHAHFARAFKLCAQLAEERPTKTHDHYLIKLCSALGWHHIEQYLLNWQLVRYPPYARSF